MSYLIDYKEIDGGYVAFGGNPKGGKITGKCKIKAGTKDETSGILKSIITRIENLVDHKVRVIRCVNETEFKNREMNKFCEMKEAVNTACYVQNKVLVVKPHNRTPYELSHGRTLTFSFIRPFRCPVTILNTKDHLDIFDGKADEGFFVGYSLNSTDFRVFKSKTKIVEENLHIRFSESTPNVVGSRPDWLFDIDALTRTMNYEPIVAGKGSECKDQEKQDNVNSTNTVNAASTNRVNAIGKNISIELPFDSDMPTLEYIGTFDFSNEDEDNDAVADMNNLETTIQVSPTPTTRIHKDHPLDKVIRDLHSATKTRNMLKNSEEHRKELCNAFEKLMHEKFSMSSMRELTFFLGLQVKQKNDGIFISQDKCVVEILKKFKFTKVKNASTPMKTQKPLLKDKDGEEGDVHMYRSRIGSLMYLTSSRWYLKGQPKLGLWYPKDSSFDLVAYTDSDYAGASLDRKSTTEGCQYLSSGLLLRQIHQWETQLHAKVDEKKTKTSQANEIASLKSRVKKLEKKQRGGNQDIDADEDITLVIDQDDAKMFNVNDDLHSEEELEANIALIKTWDDVQAKIDVDYQLAEKLQAEEQQELNEEEKATLFMQLLEKRRKFFVAKRAEEKRNKPPTQAQQRKLMCTYLKNVEGKKLTNLKNKSFDSILKMFDRAFKRVNIFLYFKTELVKGNSNRAGEELTQESAMKQKVDDDKEIADLKQLMKIILDEEGIVINAIPLAGKSLIVDWKIHKEGKKSYYQIIRAGGKSKMYLVFSHMLKEFDREDLEDLYKLVKAKYRSTRPVEDLDLILRGDLKTMFEPHIEDDV
nr:hypothetical protein [Tanacetum cinerariifolium]